MTHGNVPPLAGTWERAIWEDGLMNTYSKWLKALLNAASTVVAMLALFSSVAAAQNLGTYQISGGDLAGTGAPLHGTVTGNGFTGTLDGYPLVMFAGGQLGNGGDFDFSMALSPPPGRDQGLYMSIVGPSNLALEGLVPIHNSNPLFSPYIQESGGITTSLIDITGAGTFSAPFTMSAEVAYGAPGTTLPEGYVDFVGAGTVTVAVRSPTCVSGACGPLRFSKVDYSFAPSPTMAPEIDPSSAASGLTLLLGGLLVLRGRREHSMGVRPLELNAR
jgi:hypothetical protein